MIRSFRVANHKSIHEEQELVLLPAYEKDREVVPVAAIFGANASGKSNLLDALAFMLEAVRTSFARWEAGTGVPRNRFRLAPDSEEQPTLFAVDLMIDGVQYAYGFACDSDQILEEWLYSYPHRRKRVIFERNLTNVAFGSTVPDYKAKSDLLYGLTRENSLLLSAAAQANQDVVMPVYEWFRDFLRIRRSGRSAAALDVNRLQAVLDHNSGFAELIKVADLGITDVVVSFGQPALEGDRFGLRMLQRVYHEKSVDLAAAQRNLGELKADAAGSPASIAKASAAVRTASRDEAKAAEEIQTYLRRNGAPELRFLHGDANTPFFVEDESEGTLTWTAILVDAAEALQIGAVLLIDEIDASLHPHLTARLIGLFQDLETNPKSAQLIFTTHDATLLSPALGEDTLKRDQTWFIEKGPNGASKLFPLSDFHPRGGENTARRYLGGAYGAVPATSEYAFRQAVLGMAGVNGQA